MEMSSLNRSFDRETASKSSTQKFIELFEIQCIGFNIPSIVMNSVKRKYSVRPTV